MRRLRLLIVMSFGTLLLPMAIGWGRLGSSISLRDMVSVVAESCKAGAAPVPPPREKIPEWKEIVGTFTRLDRQGVCYVTLHANEQYTCLWYGKQWKGTWGWDGLGSKVMIEETDVGGHGGLSRYHFNTVKQGRLRCLKGFERVR